MSNNFKKLIASNFFPLIDIFLSFLTKKSLLDVRILNSSKDVNLFFLKFKFLIWIKSFLFLKLNSFIFNRSFFFSIFKTDLPPHFYFFYSL